MSRMELQRRPPNHGAPKMNRTTQTSWHAKPIDELVVQLATDVQHGLSPQEAAERLAKAGANELRKGEAVSPWTILLSQFRSLVIWVLIGAAVVSAALGEFVDGTAIIAIVLLNALNSGFVRDVEVALGSEASACTRACGRKRKRITQDVQRTLPYVATNSVCKGDLSSERNDHDTESIVVLDSDNGGGGSVDPGWDHNRERPERTRAAGDSAGER